MGIKIIIALLLFAITSFPTANINNVEAPTATPTESPFPTSSPTPLPKTNTLNENDSLNIQKDNSSIQVKNTGNGSTIHVETSGNGTANVQVKEDLHGSQTVTYSN